MPIDQILGKNGAVETAVISFKRWKIRVTPDGIYWYTEGRSDFEDSLPSNCAEALLDLLGVQNGDRRLLENAINEALVPQYGYA